jgi:hypothetical protein
MSGLATASPAAAALADTEPPVVDSIAVTPDAVSVSGLDLVTVTVAVHLTDESSVSTGALSEVSAGNHPYVVLRRVSGGDGRTERADLHLTSGTAEDGTWNATIHVPSTFNGEWEAVVVRAFDSAGNELQVDPRTLSIEAGLSVTGTHLPTITATFRPNPAVAGQPLSIEGRATFTDTGQGIPNTPVVVSFDTGCVPFELAEPRRTVTDSTGRYSYTFAEARSDSYCAYLPRPTSVEGGPAFIAIARVEVNVNEGLPITGASLSALIGVGIALVAVGGLLVVLAFRRRRIA